ncbi:MAG: HU family DNA-binding protein [Sulfurihydrogenibium sp.]|uniref:HU family DNA-binding protein n=1 Tax=Sulfurihydrogenibium sp. TaxID=2053621 RepID=UPI000CC8C969|nr:MAG: DNA-binding protein [Sulfurihydrogenibium sp.]PMP77806.1 MAG: DNA-binding protein [Sulfurihydrogenibium sp.]
MKKSDIVKILKQKYKDIETKEIKKVVDAIFEKMIEGLASGEKIEIRKLGTFKVLKRKKPIKGKKRVSYSKTVHFKAGKILKRTYKSIKVNGESNES